MAVFIHGVEYIPKTDLFHLTDSHFEQAAQFPDAFAMVKWAHESQATVAEMMAWGRAVRGEDLAPAPNTSPPPVEKKKPEKLVFPGTKPKSLFGE